MTNGTWGTTVRHDMNETPWELQNAEDALVPLEPGESFNYIGVACFIVLAAFGGILWITM